jgi:xylulokinase
LRLMGVDMGTSGCKAVVFDEKFNIVCDAYREYELSFPGEGLLELDPNVVWDNIKAVISEANGKTDKPVNALAISAIGDVILPLRYDGTPVRKAIIDFDPRGTEQIKKFVSDFGEGAFFHITGMPPLFIGSLAKILWIQTNEPQIYDKVQRWGTFEDFIVQKLGRAPSVSYSEAARTMLFDIRDKAWSKQVLDKIPMDERMLPKVVPSGTKLGKVQAGLAKKLGFSKSPEIVSGGHDMVCAAIGAGLDERKSDTAVNIAGTIEGIVVAMDKANTGAAMLDNLFPCYPGYDGYVTFSVNLTAGCILRWYRDVIASDTYELCKMSGEDVFEKLLEALEADKPSEMIFLPHFSGSGNPHFDPNAKGTIYGLTLSSTRDDIVQAMIEGLCYEIKLHSDALRKAGIDISAIRSVGGGAKIDKQLQLKANITGLIVIKGNVSESSALGAAAMAGVAMGQIKHPSEAFATAAKKEKRFVPQSETKKSFEKAYAKYAALFNKIHDFESQNN